MTDKPRIGFLGTGWIGRHRMAAILADGRVEAVAIADPSPEMAAEAQRLAPAAALVTTLDEILALAPDGVVIATPSALHAAQSIQVLDAGAAVFCQKPLGRSGDEAAAVVAAARAADRLLGVDLSYRFTTGMQRIAALVRNGELGDIHSVDLVFHNAYGPDKPWFYDRAQSGGGCVMDLGVHLVDLALWTLGFSEVREVRSHLTAGGRPVAADGIEDFAIAEIVLATGTIIRLACSWRAHAGRDAEISAQFYGTAGGAALRNVDGSFYDFSAERYRGTAAEPLSTPPEEWGGRAAVDWARRLADGQRFDPAADHLIVVSRVLDRIYAG
ncbi:Gfo/Idh/MocA family protein [Sphingomonas sp. Tas61C01]|uniref:Gfo/Idh/MocA family protein n=1 Tax=Sphingomonas sp. Tas61C01 TaxID=3458297 RepID=UPI00403EF107